jgi:hypothetical protein
MLPASAAAATAKVDIQLKVLGEDILKMTYTGSQMESKRSRDYPKATKTIRIMRTPRTPQDGLSEDEFDKLAA